MAQYSCESSSSSKCFPAEATVQLRDGKTKTMAQLTVGDEVLVANGEFSEVYMFSHRYEDSENTFVQLTTRASSLKLSADHYLYVNGRLATAATVKIGDVLVGADGKDVVVEAVNTTRATGLYNPHTMHGDIVVNGIKTSTYTKAVSPALAHAALWPVRLAYSLGQDIVGDNFAAGSELLADVMPDGKDKY